MTEPATPLRRPLLALQPFMVAGWLLAALLRAIEGDWQVAVLDAYIALLTFMLWDALNGRSGS